MPILIKLTLTLLLSFLISSVSIATLRTNLLDIGCDPKFHCLCSLSCLITSIMICALIFGVSFLVAYWVFAKGKFVQINKYQILINSALGALIGLLVFGYPLATIIIIYGGYFTVWLPLTIFVSVMTIQLLKRFSNLSKLDE